MPFRAQRTAAGRRPAGPSDDSFAIENRLDLVARARERRRDLRLAFVEAGGRDDDGDRGQSAHGVAHRRAHGGDADGVLLAVVGDARRADLVELAEQRLAVGDRVLGASPSDARGRRSASSSGGRAASSALPLAVAVKGEPRADLGDDPQGATRRVLVDEQHLAAVEHGQVDRLAQLVGEPLEIGADLVAQVAAAGDREADQGGTDAQLARRRRRARSPPGRAPRRCGGRWSAAARPGPRARSTSGRAARRPAGAAFRRRGR